MKLPRPDETLKLPVRVGPYRVLRPLAEGGMGTVFEAVQESLERSVALKVLRSELAIDADFHGRFLDEARILGQLAHPSIVQVLEAGKSQDGTMYIAMELLNGESLGSRLRTLVEKRRHFAVGAALQLAWQAADALRTAHAGGIIHRDIKPDNLMLINEPGVIGGERIKILDFGIAKLTGKALKRTIRTGAQVVLGTPRYMSPEQFESAGNVDEMTDVYSLGCVIYEMLSGRAPFVVQDDLDLKEMHQLVRPEPIGNLNAQVPVQLSELVHKMICKERSRRPSMSEVTIELDRLSRLNPPDTAIEQSAPIQSKRTKAPTMARKTDGISITAVSTALPHARFQPWYLSTSFLIMLMCLTGGCVLLLIQFKRSHEPPGSPPQHKHASNTPDVNTKGTGGNLPNSIRADLGVPDFERLSTEKKEKSNRTESNHNLMIQPYKQQPNLDHESHAWTNDEWAAPLLNVDLGIKNR